MTDTVTFWLAVVGSRVAARFADAIAQRDLRPKHVGLLTVLSTLENGQSLSQQELALALRVAPSLVVALADHLEQLGAIRRERDPTDRRRQSVAITATGRRLLADCATVAASMDAYLADGVDGKALIQMLAQVGANEDTDFAGSA